MPIIPRRCLPHQIDPERKVRVIEIQSGFVVEISKSIQDFIFLAPKCFLLKQDGTQPGKGTNPGHVPVPVLHTEIIESAVSVFDVKMLYILSYNNNFLEFQETMKSLLVSKQNQ